VAGLRLLVVNPGSSSLKLRLLGAGDALEADEEVPAPEGRLDEAALERFLTALPADAVAYRVVHGGERYREAALLDAGAVGYLRSLIPLAPLHQRFALEAVDAGRRLLPQVPHVACFDTSFHANLPAAASVYAIPREWRERYGIRRFGFHGLSHAYASRQARERLPLARRIVTCHLGSGASLAAVLDGQSVDTTMGFTPLEGLVMATRSGSLDPGILEYLQRQAGLSAEEVFAGLQHRSGLRGLAGTDDMRQVLERAAAGEPGAVLALGVYLHHLRAGIAAMAAALGGLDAVVFTGGVGEHAPEIRLRAVDGLGFLGQLRTLVVESREDLEISRQARPLLAG
jgi:acetate kinase